MWRFRKPPQSVMPTSSSAARLAFTAWRSSADLPRPPAESSTFSHTVTPVGLPALIGARRLRRSTWRTTRGYPCTYGSTKPVPRNQGAALTAFELGAHGVPHTVVADNLGGHLMQRGQVDMVIVGSDRTTAGGDVCNKVGTYLKALAARDNGVPFYAALPVSSIDWSLQAGSAIPIEERSPEEVTHITGRSASGRIETVRLVPDRSPALNLAFDVTPARLVTGTDHGARRLLGKSCRLATTVS